MVEKRALSSDAMIPGSSLSEFTLFNMRDAELGNCARAEMYDCVEYAVSFEN